MITLAKAYQKYVRQSPRKLRLIADMVRGKTVSQALVDLAFTPKKGARLLRAVVLQAQANAKAKQPVEEMWLSDVQIEEGPRLKRWNPVSRGRAHPILKRMSHIKVVVSGKTVDAKKQVKG
jgi:large subunit ribosomal protein L22